MLLKVSREYSVIGGYYLKGEWSQISELGCDRGFVLWEDKLGRMGKALGSFMTTRRQDNQITSLQLEQ